MKPVSGKRFARALRRKGWTLIRTKGDHQTYLSPDGRTPVTVPASNRDLKFGTQHGLMKDTGLTDADL